MMDSPIIVAVDSTDRDVLEEQIHQFSPEDCAIKIGLMSYLTIGADGLRALVDEGYRVFLDLKFHDIPHQVAKACEQAAQMGVWMLTIHAGGGVPMCKAAVEAVRCGRNPPKVVAVTALTSLDANDVQQISNHRSVQSWSEQLVGLAIQSACDGVVCSAADLGWIKPQLPDSMLTVTPGIRCASDAHDDQKRVVTPEQAVQAGSDYCVIGRSITGSNHPAALLKQIRAHCQRVRHQVGESTAE